MTVSHAQQDRRAAASGEIVANQEAAVKLPSSIANLEMIAKARRVGLAQAMADSLKEPYLPDPLDPSLEEPQRLGRLSAPFFAALRDLGIVGQIADLAKVPPERRLEFITAMRRLLWVATVRVLVRHRGAKLDVKGMKNALAAVLRARDALQQLDGLVDTAPLEPSIADLSLWLGANPERGAAAKRGPPLRKRWRLDIQVVRP